MSQASSAPSGNESATADHANSQRAQRPLTQIEVDAAMIAEEKRRRNTAASGKVENLGRKNHLRPELKACSKTFSIKMADWHS